METKIETEIQITETNAPAIYVRGGLSQFLDAVKAEVEAEIPDLTTKKGRDRIASLAAKVSRSKTAVERPGREYLKRLKEMPKVVEEELREFTRAMDLLRDETRKPLTAWEDAEKARVFRYRDAIESMRQRESVLGMTAAQIQTSIEQAEAVAIDETWEEFEAEGHRTKAEILVALRDSLAIQQRIEAERAELEKMRQLQAEQDAKAERERIAAEAAERATREAEEKAAAEREAAERRELDLKLQAERAQRELAEAAERATREREEAARRQAEAVARAESAERQRIADEQAEMERQARLREADRKHKTAIMTAAKEAVMSVGVSEDLARDVIKLIAAGNVPNVAIKF